jgi:glutaconate CoA-transferase subunit B
MPSFELFTDWRDNRWAESYWISNEIFDDMKLYTRRVFFVSGIQIDMFGNINLFGIGTNYRKLKFRGPGGLGAATASTFVNRYYIFANSHNKRTFVKECDYITAFGWGEGGKDARTRLGLVGAGPQLCITPLCVMDFQEETKTMRLKSLHPGVTLEQVLANTEFEPIIPSKIVETKPPSPEELQILRTRVDPSGQLRR